ncbi:MAG: hypothetical protein ABI639_05095 [Thermoanaerobaculia bacterium]
MASTGSTILERTTRFTVDGAAGCPKLQEGVYLLALGSGIWDHGWSGTLAELRAIDGLDSIAIEIRAVE